MTGSTALPAGKGSKIWVKGGTSKTYAGKVWGVYTGYTNGGKIGKKTYSSTSKALKACKASKTCNSVVKTNKNKYFLSTYKKSKKTKKSGQ